MQAFAGEPVAVLGLAHQMRWSGARLEEVTERALATDNRTPHERRRAFLALVERAAQKTRGRRAA
jgi:hypothetical protein